MASKKKPGMMHYNASGKYYILRVLCGRGNVGVGCAELVTCPRCLEMLAKTESDKFLPQ